MHSLLSGFSFLSGLYSLSIVPLIDSFVSELLVSLGTLHLSGDGLDLASLGDGWKGENTIGGVLSGTLQLLGGGIVDLTLLWLVSASWEEDQFLLVLTESSNVGGHSFGIFVVSSVVNGDSNSSSPGLGELCLSEFSEGETSSELNLISVSFGLTMHNWSELRNGSNSGSSSLRSSLLSSNLFVSVLVKIALDSSHPMFSEMGALNHVIVFHVAY